MLRSMTGFATQSTTLVLNDTSPIEVTITIKSLNSRFFEGQCKLPLSLNNFETDILKRLKNNLIRGYVQCIIQIPDCAALKNSAQPSIDMVKSYMNAIEYIKNNTVVAGKIELKDLIYLPNVFIFENQKINEQLVKKIFTTLDSAINAIIADQKKEGALLLQDLQNRTKLIKKEIQKIEKRATKLMEEKKELVHKELQTLEADENKLMDIAKSAVYIILDKIDIHEELVRFNSHLHNLSSLLSDKKTIEIGKRLDFTLQELGREINTITAKCSCAAISTHAINIKVELEKAREQTQNII
jgi:uncharacterized protein (TIGR00255 family)